MTHLPELCIRLANPRGFCAGVDRAVKIVERTLESRGAPVYVRHEIVHNPHVVETLRKRGAIFVEELDEIPEADRTTRPVIFSAHGVPKSVPEQAASFNMSVTDATCPLVSKVHREAEAHHRAGRTVIMIGHRGHPEVIGTMGQLPDGAVHLVETCADVESLNFPQNSDLALITQTTLSVGDTADIAAALRARYSNIREPRRGDICYATTNRQHAVAEIAKSCDLFLVIGAQNSSNSNRLVEVARDSGCSKTYLITDANAIDWNWFQDVRTLGLSAGASAPERLVQDVLDTLAKHYKTTIFDEPTLIEDVEFRLPGHLMTDADRTDRKRREQENQK